MIEKERKQWETLQKETLLQARVYIENEKNKEMKNRLEKMKMKHNKPQAV